LTEALATAYTSGERFYEAEIHRLRGEQLLMQGAGENDVEQHYKEAIKVARQFGAKSLELRAISSLSRLWHKQGKSAQALQMLEEIYGWFTEGFDTADLKEAKALLDELSGD
jgi:adenylate cyclase